MESRSFRYYIDVMEETKMDHLTAKVSCFARAFHTEMNRLPIFSDPWAKRLLGEEYEMIAHHMEEGICYFVPGFQGTREEGLRLIADRQLSPSVLGRSAFSEKIWTAYKENGCRQAVILASGYDTFGIRIKDMDIAVYEIDMPEMIEEKKIRVQKADLSSSSIYVPCDLSNPSWVWKLTDAGFDPNRQAFTCMLGLSYYLDRESFRRLVRDLADLLKAGSGLCFDYPISDSSPECDRNRELADGAKEEMKARYTEEEMTAFLTEAGFEIAERLDSEAMTEHYFSAYNQAEPDHRIEAPKGVSYIHAKVRKRK